MMTFGVSTFRHFAKYFFNLIARGGRRPARDMRNERDEQKQKKINPETSPVRGRDMMTKLNR
jgi:hypothetical protein